MPIRTYGISPKVLAPIITALSAVLTSWITTGNLNRPELAALAVTAIGAIAAYVAPPGEITTPELEALPFDIDELTGQEETAADAPA